MRKRLLALLLALGSLVPFTTSGVTAPAHATNTTQGEFTFVATGNLPIYPTDKTEQATFNGTITGNGQVTGQNSSGQLVTANITLQNAPMGGGLEYNVARFPYCLALTQAAASTAPKYNGYVGPFTINSGAGVAGEVYRVGDTTGGIVTSVTIGFTFTYQRVTAAAAVVVQGGVVTVNYSIPGRGTGSFTANFLGGGPGVVTYTNPQLATTYCINNQPGSGPISNPQGPVGYAVNGTVTLGGAS